MEGLNAQKTSELRRACFAEDIKLVVVKNTLLKRTLEQVSVEETDLLFPYWKVPRLLCSPGMSMHLLNLSNHLVRRTENPF